MKYWKNILIKRRNNEYTRVATITGFTFGTKSFKNKSTYPRMVLSLGGQVYVSFSGGKDSTVLLDIVRQEFPNVEAVYVDTGLEYPEIKEFVKTFENVLILKPKMTFKQVLEKYGYPVISKEVSRAIYYAKRNSQWALDKLSGNSFLDMRKWNYLKELNVSDECCYVMKKRPIKIYEKEKDKKPFVDMLATESLMRKNSYLKSGCNSFSENMPISSPLGFWTENDILKYIKENNLKICSVYGEVFQRDLTGNKLELTGVDRTGCMFCMFGVHLEKGENRFQRMKKTHPQIYDYCINKLKIGEVLDYIGVKY